MAGGGWGCCSPRVGVGRVVLQVPMGGDGVLLDKHGGAGEVIVKLADEELIQSDEAPRPLPILRTRKTVHVRLPGKPDHD